MEFDHERLEVYKVSLDFLVFAERLLNAFPRGRGYFADQLSIETSQQALLGEITAQEMADQWAEYLTAEYAKYKEAGGN